MLDLLCFSHCCFPVTTEAVKELDYYGMLCNGCVLNHLINYSTYQIIRPLVRSCVMAVFSLFDLYLNSLHCYVMSQQESQQLISCDYKQVVLSLFYCSFFLIFYQSTKPIYCLPALVKRSPIRASLFHSFSLHQSPSEQASEVLL